MSDIQYTVRNVPADIDLAIKRRAKVTGKSVNKTIISILRSASAGSDRVESHKKNDLSFIFNTGTLDEKFDEAIADQSKIDPEMWQ